MKTTTFFRILFLALLVVAATGNGAMAQTDSCAVNVIHTYMNGRPVQWDSVEIKVNYAPYHTRTFMMYWPDTLLSNCPTSIEEYMPDNELGLSQNFPNPCQGETSVGLSVRTAGNVNLQITDMQGRICCHRTFFLPVGEHLLSLKLPASGIYFIQAQTATGNEVCKVLCSEGRGTNYDIKVMSSSLQFTEKAGKGGENQFNMTDKMRVTAYITYNGNVHSSSVVVNYTFDDMVYMSDSLYTFGSVNIHFLGNDSCENYILSGKTFKMLIASHSCQPFMDYPVGSSVTFSDSTFISTPTSFFPYFSSTWQFHGQYKYRYYPHLNNMLCIFSVDETLPPEGIESVSDLAPYNFYSRLLRLRTCDVVLISQYSSMQGYFYNEMMLLDE